MSDVTEAAASPMAGLDDGALARSYLRSGAGDALAEIMRRYGSLVAGVCRRQLGNGQSADDAAQATFLLLMHKRERLGEDIVLARWLYWAARHVAGAAHRAERARRLHETAAVAATGRPSAPAADDAELWALVEQALARLPASQRDAILLHHARGMSLADAAEEIGCPMRTVQARVNRGMAKLKAQVLRARGDAALGALAGILAGPAGWVPHPEILLSPTRALPHDIVRLAAGGARSAAAAKAIGLATVLAAVVLAGAAALLPVLAASSRVELAAAASTPVAGTLPHSAERELPLALAAIGVLGRHRGDTVRSMAFSHDGGWLATCGYDGDVDVWDPTTRMQRGGIAMGDKVRSVAVSPDDARIALVIGSRAVVAAVPIRRAPGSVPSSYYNPPQLDLVGHSNVVARIAYSPDGRLIATGSDDTTIRLWDAGNGHALATLRGHRDSIRGLAFSPDGARLASGSNDRTVRLWSVAERRELVQVSTSSEVVDLAFSPRGDLVAVAAGGSIALLDARTLATLHQLSADSARSFCVRFSADGALVGTGGQDGFLRLWDPASGRLLAQLQMAREVVCLAFSPDGRLIASGSWGPEVMLTSIIPGALPAVTPRG